MHSGSISSKSFFKIRVPLYLLLITVVIAIALLFISARLEKRNSVNETSAVESTSFANCQMHLIRQSDYKLIHPLLLADMEDESSKLKNLKTGLTQLINQKVNSGIANSISVYVRELTDGNWISINGAIPYYPGSIMKVAILIAWLQMDELNPQTLKRKIFFKKSLAFAHMQTYDDRAMVEGKYYSINELLKFMICNSDNDATYLLQTNMDLNVFSELFTEIGLPKPDVNSPDLTISAEDYSKFFRILFNSTYLNRANSEYALELLAKSDFNEGLVSQLPKNVIVAHKFGERTNGKDVNFHDSGIIYLDNHPYLVTIMTRGENPKTQAAAIGDIAKFIFDQISSLN